MYIIPHSWGFLFVLFLIIRKEFEKKVKSFFYSSMKVNLKYENFVVFQKKYFTF